MTPEEEKKEYQALEEVFSLEEILAEYGGSVQQKLLEEVETKAFSDGDLTPSAVEVDATGREDDLLPVMLCLPKKPLP